MRRSFLFSIILLVVTLSFITGYSHQESKECEYPIRFAVLGDRTGSHVPGVFKQIVEEVQRMTPDFVMTVGDFIEGYTGDTVVIKNEWEEFKGLLEPLTMSIYLVPGNHDIWDTVSLGYYNRYNGEPYYSFNVKDLHFVMLDNSLYYDDSVFVRERKDQIEWLIDDLKKHKSSLYTFVFFHIPYWIETRAKGKNDTLHNIFVKYGVDAVFTGHYHQYFSGKFDGILYTGMGSSGGGTTPGPTGLMFHFAWVTVDEGGISIALIKKDAVLPWDELTSDDFHLVSKIKDEAISIEKASVGTKIAVPKKKIKIVIGNLNDQLILKDTLRWSLPSGWSIEPSQFPLEIEPGSTQMTEFVVQSKNNLYPMPELFLRYPYAENKSFEIKKPLQISRTAYAIKVDKPPLIDGKLTEIFWKKPTTEFFAPDGSPVTTDPVSFYFAWDDDNLYIAAKCVETKMDEMVANASEHDGSVWLDDCIGYFFQPDTEDGPVYQIYFNAIGTIFDQKIKVENQIAVDADRGWNGTYEVETEKGKDYWSIEARIPLDQLEAKDKTGKTWAINFRRKQKRLNTTADWQIPVGYNPVDYGILKMKLIR